MEKGGRKAGRKDGGRRGRLVQLAGEASRHLAGEAGCARANPQGAGQSGVN